MKVWKTHPLFGRRMWYQTGKDRFEVEVVNVAAGPMMVDTSKFDQPEADISSTIKLQVRRLDGTGTFWTAPMKYKPTEAVSNG